MAGWLRTLEGRVKYPLHLKDLVMRTMDKEDKSQPPFLPVEEGNVVGIGNSIPSLRVVTCGGMWTRRVCHQASRCASALSGALGLSRRWISSGSRFAALWGNGDYGRLGLGHLNSQWKPAICPAFGGNNDNSLRAIACGGAHTLFLTGILPFPPIFRPPSLSDTRTVLMHDVSPLARGILSDSKWVEQWWVLIWSLKGVLVCTAHLFWRCPSLHHLPHVLYFCEDEFFMNPFFEPLKVPEISKEVIQISAGYRHSSAITGEKLWRGNRLSKMRHVTIGAAWAACLGLVCWCLGSALAGTCFGSAYWTHWFQLLLPPMPDVVTAAKHRIPAGPCLSPAYPTTHLAWWPPDERGFVKPFVVDGELYMWGNNSSGQLGLGRSNVTYPLVITL
ncbi:hypothetical protein ACLOJK_013820 [Asimina triloba]